jgi:hypothetical protein
VFASGPPLIDKHDWTYLEWEIPQSLEEKLSKMISKELNKFYKKCQCNVCKRDRGEEHQMNDGTIIHKTLKTKEQ